MYDVYGIGGEQNWHQTYHDFLLFKISPGFPQVKNLEPLGNGIKLGIIHSIDLVKAGKIWRKHKLNINQVKQSHG